MGELFGFGRLKEARRRLFAFQDITSFYRSVDNGAMKYVIF
jgi:hypothetical protein